MSHPRSIVAAAILSSAVVVTGCSTVSAPTPEAGGPAITGDCEIVADIAAQLGGDNFDPNVGGRDCRQAFEDPGLPMLGLRKPGDPDSAPGLPHILQFEAPQHLDDGTVRLRLSFTCPRLCGHGEEVVAQPQGRRWVIVSRKTTWMS